MSLAILDFINYLFLPEYCITCGKYGNYICSKCLKYKFKVNFKDICHVCGYSAFNCRLHKECEDSTNLDRLYYFCEYNSASKKLIEEVKYNGSYAVIPELAKHMAKYFNFKNQDFNKDDFVISYIPSHKVKKNQRGFNQSELLAKEVSKLLDISFVHTLVKIQNTKKQAGSSKNSRSSNLSRTFMSNKIPENKVIILIDDVHTTGATLNECSSVLKRSGVEQIWGFTFAKSMNYSAVNQ